MKSYFGRMAEVKNPESPFYSQTGMIRGNKDGQFAVELSEGVVIFERKELRIKREARTYDAEVYTDEEPGAGDYQSDEITADNMVDAVMQATDGGEEIAKLSLTTGSTKAEPGKSHTRPRTEPKTAVRNTLEALSYPYTIALPMAYARLLERKAGGIYGLSMKKRFGRIQVTVESAEALNHLYEKLDTKRPGAQARTILEGIRRSAK